MKKLKRRRRSVTYGYLRAIAAASDDVIGVEWNQGTDTWRRIDEFGNTITSLTTSDFDKHSIWGRMWRCTLTPAGAATFGSNARGDGLDLTGTSGRVMVRIPKFYVKSTNPSTNVYRWWISSSPFAGAVVHPAFFQRGGVKRNQIYIGAYAADFEYDGDNEAYNAAHEKLHSRTGKQPYTGAADCVWSIPIDDLGAEPSIGDVIAGTEGGFILIDYLKTAGAWGGGGAGDTAIIWIRKPGDDTCGILNNDAITADGSPLGNATAGPTGLQVTLGNCRTRCENIGTGWGIENIWTHSALKLLWYIENATGNSQTALGRGIVDKASGTGFAGELTGADSADTNISTNGTGTGTGSDGLTPVVYRGIENPWGNCFNFIDGYNAVNAEYRIINRDGTGTFADTLTAGNYEASTAVPITSDGYISNIEYEDLLALLFIPKAVEGSSSTYLCDGTKAHDTGETNTMRIGGSWDSADPAGIAYCISWGVSTDTSRVIGARIEFI